MAFFVYYRISDKGNIKEKLPGTDKFICLQNAIQEFGQKNFHIIADNCSKETVEFIKTYANNNKGKIFFEETSLGNSASFLYMVNLILQKHNSDDYVYLIEDDYIHRPGSRKVLLEGLEIADYVTLYDHPDKYWLESDNGNPFNYKQFQKTRIYVTKSAHWRETNSATMTFACSVKTLQDDHNIWIEYNQECIPDDFHAFMKITQNSFFYMISFLLQRRKKAFFVLLNNFLTRKKTKKLLSVIPSYATHAETAWIAPVVQWDLFLP
jgi:hypothetical protein